jgi:hypothetical protein
MLEMTCWISGILSSLMTVETKFAAYSVLNGTMDADALSDEEFAERGNAIFEEQVLPNIDDPEAKARHFVVIDIETGEYEVSEEPIRSSDATQRLLERCPEAKGRIWIRRVGSPVAHRIGGRFLPAGKNAP